jgi:hypothetical protein
LPAASIERRHAQFVVVVALLFFHHQRAQLAFQGIEFGLGRIALARQGDQDVALDGAGTVGHDDDAVGQVDRLLDAAGDENDRVLQFGPDAQQLVLQVAPGERAPNGSSMSMMGESSARARSS